MEKSFSDKCYVALKLVPKGRVTTYKLLAHAIGSHAYRAVGTAMKNNPNPSSEAPCHRVVNSDGRVGEYVFSRTAKEELLRNEGVKIRDGRIVNFSEVLFRF